MKDKDIKIVAFQKTRMIFYAVLLANGIFIQYFAPFKYKCDYTDEKCFACGLRTAINLIMQGRYTEAYQSNKLIVLIISVFILMRVDAAFCLFKKKQKA